MRIICLLNVITVAVLVVVLDVLLAFTDYDTNETGAVTITSRKRPTQNLKTLNMLDVPFFYVYEELFFSNATVGNYTLIEWMQYQRERRHSKHEDDYWFAIASLQHPLRTKDPSLAKLFVVPLITNQITGDMDYYKLKICVRFEHLNNGTLCQQQLLQHADWTLEASPWFQKSQGRNHILVASDHMAPYFLTPYKHLSHCNVIGFEHSRWNALSRMFLPKLYVGTRCLHNNGGVGGGDRPHDVVMVARIKEKFTTRRRICTYLKNQTVVSVANCGGGQQCPALAQSKLGFHARGDTPGSNRLIDLILTGTVPVFTTLEQYDILPPWIDWASLSYFVDENLSPASVFLSKLHDILMGEGLAQKLKALLDNYALVDWEFNSDIVFEQYMYAFARTLLPQEQKRMQAARSPFSALDLSAFETLQPMQDGNFVYCYAGQRVSSCQDCSWCTGQCMPCKHGSTNDPSAKCVPRYNATCRMK